MTFDFINVTGSGFSTSFRHVVSRDDEFNNVGCVLRTISISANFHVIDSSQPVAYTNLVMVHGMHPTGLPGSKWPKIKPTPH